MSDRSRIFSRVAGVLGLAAGMLAAAPAGAQQAQAAARKASPARGLGVDTAGFDRTVRPQDDFSRFVSGRWAERTQIPADRSSWGSFNALEDASDAALHRIVEEAAQSGAKPGTELQKVGDLYASFMDTATIESLGLKRLQGELARLATLKSTRELPGALAHLARLGVSGPFVALVMPDQKNSRANIVTLSQSGLGMPDRDYYLRPDAKLEATRKAYATYVTRLLELAGQADPAGAAQRIVALETKLAEKQWERAKNRDRNATYNRMTVAQLAALTPSFDWAGYLKAAGLGAATEVVVRQPDYLQALDAIVSATPVSTWQEYLTYRLLSAYADELPSAFVQASFDFRGKTLAGLQEMRPRWKRGVDEVEGALGEAAGKLYVERNFKPEAKARMDALVRNLLAAYRAGIDSLEWMSPETKTQAQAKLAKFTVKIAYPDKWRDYSSLEIRPGDLLGNVMRANAFAYDDMVDRLGKPVDRSRWGMTPQTVNAYYNATNNEIVFPAAILQPPFFDVDADDATNYGAIGAVIGHEISHGFDDQGRKSDGDGNLRDWWTAADAKAFEERATKLADQYGSYVPIDSLHINGRLTLGENIGDLSGLAVAYRAYRMSLGGKEAPVIDGFTGDQRFFLGWAQVWRTKMRDEALRNQLLTNPHSPGMYRAFVPLTNLDPFYEAFDVKPGDRMYRAPEERVKIW
ncbi:MAG TPA: M13-type metalloendopeptidase [Longimicrobiales bacterium]|nr:M13-type metalloendopeptidase [Longimicrobiales bacterium]